MAVNPNDVLTQGKLWIDVIAQLAFYGLVTYAAISAKLQSVRNASKTEEIAKRQDRHAEAIRKLGEDKVDISKDNQGN